MFITSRNTQVVVFLVIVLAALLGVGFYLFRHQDHLNPTCTQIRNEPDNPLEGKTYPQALCDGDVQP